ncbi:MAG: HEAT repeat domain-containing protein [Acidobacteriaceae bacterium]|nr:HEAT repeat domain-containing protein [Acidobacteriaceae bacterium]MBV9293983.1 HEAT repeat domain-containing protein [Acidobacteriaceae bacterium]MBV9766682.1 HEAT repeat domain-containing protein [Acidobacteriaceae bacterium]
MICILLLLSASVVQQPEESPVDSAWSVLQAGVESKSSDRRAKAVHALGLLPKNQKAQEMAEKALTDPSEEVKLEGATALGQIGATSSRPKLELVLQDKDIKVVVAAANSLYLLKDPAAYEVYYALLTGERKSSASLLQTQLNTLRDRKAVEKLAFEAGIGFVPFGGMGYEAWKTVTQDDTSAVKAAAAEKLATDPDPKSGQALVKSCSDKKWRVRVAVVSAIAKRGDPSLVPALVPLLSDESDSVQYTAAAAILYLSTHPKRENKQKRPAAPKT